MKQILPSLDSRSAQIALKSCLAVVIGFAIALKLNWKPSFGAILVVVLQTPALGATFKKGILYIAGTLSGAIAGMVLVALFAHDRNAFIVAAALLITFGLYCQQISRYPYAWLIFNVTFILVAFFSHKAFSYTFDIAVMRSSTICLAVVIVFLAHGLLWPIRAGKTFERQLHGFLEGCLGLLSLTSRMLDGDKPNPDDVRKAETDQINAITKLSGTLESAANDTERFRQYHAGYEQLVAQLYDLLQIILAVLDGIKGSHDNQAGKPLITDSDNIRSSLDPVEEEMKELVCDLALPRDGTRGARESDARSAAGIDQTAPIDTASAAMLAGGLRSLERQVSNVRATLTGVEDPEQSPPPLPAPSRTPFSLTSVKSRKAAAGGLVILLSGWFFIQTQWPMGLMLGMVFSTIAICFSAMLPLIMIRRQLLLSLVIGPTIAAPIYFGIMPGINQYPQLIPWLFLALFPLFYLMASKPRKIMQYLFAAIFVCALINLDEERQSYSFAAFANMWFGFFGGFAGALAVFALFSSVVPEREFCKQVRSFFSGCSESMQALAKIPLGTADSDAMIKASRKQWPGLFKKLKIWSSQINYTRVPGNNRQATQALIGSIEHTALRLNAVEYVHQQSVEVLDEPLRKLIGRVYEACFESFQLIANSLTDLKPIPDLPQTQNLVREIESRGNDLSRSAGGDNDILTSVQDALRITAHMNMLADELNNCRDKVNALDWNSWNRNYF
ncbi:MAG: FUSC family protein [Planctomycetota bacterium]